MSFMAPYSDAKWSEEAATELFSSLFGNYDKAMAGKATNSDDDDDNDDDKEKQEESLDEIKIL